MGIQQIQRISRIAHGDMKRVLEKPPGVSTVQGCIKRGVHSREREKDGWTRERCGRKIPQILNKKGMVQCEMFQGDQADWCNEKCPLV